MVAYPVLSPRHHACPPEDIRATRITVVEKGAKLLKIVVSEGKTAPDLSELTASCDKSFTEH